MIEKVIDSSAIAKFILKEEGRRDVEKILIERPYTLDLAVKEVANVIWRRTILLRDLSVENAVRLLNHLLDLRRRRFLG